LVLTTLIDFQINNCNYLNCWCEPHLHKGWLRIFRVRTL